MFALCVGGVSWGYSGFLLCVRLIGDSKFDIGVDVSGDGYVSMLEL